MSVLVPARRPSHESLDDPSLPSDEMAGSLADIAMLDRAWGGSRVLARWLLGRPALASAGRSTVLDLGAGSAEPSRRLRRRLAEARIAADVFALDLQWRHLAAGGRWNDRDKLPGVAGDALRLPLQDGSVDWVVSTLLLHHFAPEQLASLLAEVRRVARHGFALLDLRRHVFPLVFVAAAGRLAFRTRTSLHDGIASVRQAYTRQELAAIGRQAGRGIQVTRVFPYRLLVTAELS